MLTKVYVLCGSLAESDVLEMLAEGGDLDTWFRDGYVHMLPVVACTSFMLGKVAPSEAYKDYNLVP